MVTRHWYRDAFKKKEKKVLLLKDLWELWKQSLQIYDFTYKKDELDHTFNEYS